MRNFAKILLLSSFSLKAFSAEPQFKVIRALSYAEISTAQLFHADKLWIGISRLGFKAYYAVELYTPEGQLLQHLKIAHTADNMYEYGPDAVLVIGRANEAPTSSYYTIIKLEENHLKIVKHVNFGTEMTTQFFAGTPDGAQFFGAPGGKDSINLEEKFPAEIGTRSVFSESYFQPRFLVARFGFLKGLVMANNSLFAVQSSGFYMGDNIVRFDLSKPEAKYGKVLFSARAYGKLSKFDRLDSDLLVASAPESGRVLLINSLTDALTVIDLKEYGSPIDAKSLGKCIVVATRDTRKVVFYDLKTQKVLKVWDYSVIGPDLINIRSLSLDAHRGRAYVKAVLPFNPLDGTPPPKRNSIAFGQEDNGETFAACLN